MTTAQAQHSFDPYHWDIFCSEAFVQQGAVGDVPSKFDNTFRLGVEEKTGFVMPQDKLTRDQVKAICRDPKVHVLAGYAVAMAWGIQSAHPRNVHSAWEQRADLERILVQLREEVPNRRKAYSLFMADKGVIRVKGLGPSYFTKLIDFFQPPGPGDRFIMDIWTARSVNLLTGRTVVLLAGSSPIKKNTPDHYDDFCNVVLEMAAQRGCTGDELEQMLFSVGGRGSRKGAWRHHVATHFPVTTGSSRF